MGHFFFKAIKFNPHRSPGRHGDLSPRDFVHFHFFLPPSGLAFVNLTHPHLWFFSPLSSSPPFPLLTHCHLYHFFTVLLPVDYLPPPSSPYPSVTPAPPFNSRFSHTPSLQTSPPEKSLSPFSLEPFFPPSLSWEVPAKRPHNAFRADLL